MESSDDEEEYPSVGKPPGRTSRPHRPSQQTISPKDGAIFEAAKPKGEVALVVLETAAVGAEVVIHLLMLVMQVGGASGRPAAIAGLATWLYIFVLVSVRLMFSAWPRDSHPRLWNHTTTLYGFQWLFTVVMLRSAIIHPRSKLAQGLTIGDVVLVTILGLIVLTTRKGNRCVVLEHDRGLQPSMEPVASLLSRASFAWIDSLVWTGYQKNLKLPDIPDLASKDKAAAILQDFRQLKYVGFRYEINLC